MLSVADSPGALPAKSRRARPERAGGSAVGRREVRIIEDESGRKTAECEYVDGLPHGVARAWSPAGVLIQEAQLERGQYHGRYSTWWENGSKKEEGRFYRGTRVGLYRWFSETGKLLKEEDYGPGIQ